MRIVALILACLATPAFAVNEERVDELLGALAEADPTSWEQIEDKVWSEWSRSGSPSMDLLLDRGREALMADDYAAAIEHLTALIENAPDFAEGYNSRATAYYGAGLIGPALEDLARALEIEPRHFGALAGLGLILEESGHGAAALDAYRAALAIHPLRPHLKDSVDRLAREFDGKPI